MSRAQMGLYHELGAARGMITGYYHDYGPNMRKLDYVYHKVPYGM